MSWALYIAVSAGWIVTGFIIGRTYERERHEAKHICMKRGYVGRLN